jgi:hypothetical protein
MTAAGKFWAFKRLSRDHQLTGSALPGRTKAAKTGAIRRQPMIRTIFAVLLISSVALAQVAPGAPDDTAPATPTYRTYTYFDGIRQGSSQKGVVVVFLGSGFVAARSATGGGIMPASLVFEEGDGLRASDIVYPSPERRKFDFRKDPVDVISPKFAIEFKLSAAKRAEAGEHTLRGKLFFQVLDDGGASPPQKMDVEFPVRTVARDTMIVPAQGPPLDSFGIQPPARKPDHDKLWLIALAPILIPLTFLEFLVCGITGQDCRC